VGGAGATGTAGAGPAGGTGAAGQTASGGVASGGTGGAPSGGAGAGTAGAGGTGGLVSPTWDDVPLTAMCTSTSATDAAGQGPFFIHELEKNDDISLIRQDIRGRYNESALPGVEMHLHLRLLDYTDEGCEDKPLEGVDVYIWHTDAQGYYSGFGTRGGDDEQNPDVPYAGKPASGDLDNTDRFLRGVQTTDANGVVSFRSIFPGWYNGRALHIHFAAFKSGSTAASSRVEYNDSNSGMKWLFTTQFYFDTEFAKSIHEKNDPYKARTSIAQYATALAANENGNSKLHFTSSLAGDTDGVGGIVTAQMQILLNPKT
jgi:protocatechuate 3,4-dioxygenase beta subunit